MGHDGLKVLWTQRIQVTDEYVRFAEGEITSALSLPHSCFYTYIRGLFSTQGLPVDPHEESTLAVAKCSYMFFKLAFPRSPALSPNIFVVFY